MTEVKTTITDSEVSDWLETFDGNDAEVLLYAVVQVCTQEIFTSD